MTMYIYLVRHTAICVGKEKFLAVRWVGMMTHREYRVDRLFPVTWLDNVWEPTPPPSTGLSRLFNPCFPGLKFIHRHAVARICDQQFWFSLIYIYIDDDIIPHCKFNGPLGLMWDVPWVPSRNPKIPDYSRGAIFEIMELTDNLYWCIKSKPVGLV